MLPQSGYVIEALQILGDGKSLNAKKIDQVIGILEDALAEDAEA